MGKFLGIAFVVILISIFLMGFMSAELFSFDNVKSYDISTKTYTTIDISIYTSNDTSGVATWTDRTAAIEAIEGTLVATENGSELGIDLTSFFSNTGWKGIKLCTNGNSRHKAQVTVKCYVQSKV
jgi:hypothetical protein